MFICIHCYLPWFCMLTMVLHADAMKGEVWKMSRFEEGDWENMEFEYYLRPRQDLA